MAKEKDGEKDRDEMAKEAAEKLMADFKALSSQMADAILRNKDMARLQIH